MFSRCYPTLTDFFRHNFGWDIPLPIYSFGFFVAIGFIVAAYVLSLELKRKEKLGLIKPLKRQIIVGEPATSFELFQSALLGFILAYKLVYVATNYTAFSVHPQSFILSTDGNILGGIIGGALFAFLKYREKEKTKLPKAQKTEQIIHPYELTGDITLMAAIGGISGAKIFYLFESPGNFQSFINDPIGSFFGGLTIYGGLIGGSIVTYLYLRSKGYSFIQFADSAAPSLILAYGIGRMGCQVSGDGDWGIANPNPKPDWMPQWLWAQNYPHNIIGEGESIIGCQELHCTVLQTPVYPTPIYELFMALVIFFILWSLRKKFNYLGFMFSLYLLLNGIERFFIEQFRINTKLDLPILGWQATQAEIIASLFIVIGIVGMFLAKAKAKKMGDIDKQPH